MLLRQCLRIGWLASVIFSSTVYAAEIEGVKFDDTLKLANQELQLNGVGLRSRFGFRVYVGGLYVAQKQTKAADVLAQKGARRVALQMLREVSAEDFAKALQNGLEENHTEAQLAALKDRTAQLMTILQKTGGVKKGDVVWFDFLPETGTRVSVNANALGNSIAGEDFYLAVLRVWLGDKPVDRSFKRGLLGEKE